MRLNLLFTILFFLFLNFIGTLGEHDREYDDDHHHDYYKEQQEGWEWTGTVGLVVLVVIIALGCGLISLVSFLVCYCHGRFQKAKVGNAAVAKDKPFPVWSTNLTFYPNLAVGFGEISDGFTRVGQGQVVRTSYGDEKTDGAKWAVPLTKGKHVFEIIWPWAHRGSNASVGVGTTDAPLTVNGSRPLVGMSPHTYGLNVVQRKAVHCNKNLLTCPTDGSYVPDKFSMYVNMDDGTIGFGNDVTYWGEVIQTMSKQPMFVMIGSSKWNAEVTVIYKGSAQEGENTYKGPHFLPPLYSNAPPVPPAYQEVSEDGGPLMVQPALPQPLPPARNTGSPPPAYYGHSPVGYDYKPPNV